MRPVRAPARVVRALTGPTVHYTLDRGRAERSFWTYRPEAGGAYRLTPLGVLHSLTGLTLETEDPE